MTRSRGIGWEFVHVCVDDCTRLAYVEVLDDERKETVTAFLTRAVAWFAGHGVRVERLMTDNGSGYRSKLHRKACEALGIRHLFTRPYRPRTNGKAERFIRTLLAGWAYKRPYDTSIERRAALDGFLTRYNTQRPHRSLNGQTPYPAPDREKQDCCCLHLGTVDDRRLAGPTQREARTHLTSR